MDRDSENNELLIQSGLTQSNILRKPFLPDKLSQKLNFFTRAQLERKGSVPETLVSKKYNFDLSDLESLEDASGEVIPEMIHLLIQTMEADLPALRLAIRNHTIETVSRLILSLHDSCSFFKITSIQNILNTLENDFRDSSTSSNEHELLLDRLDSEWTLVKSNFLEILEKVQPECKND